jgi:type IV fimbrial biogenesis protein FimT
MYRKTAAGFTLIELVVTVAVIAILAALAFPSFESTMRSNRVATTNNQLVASLALARSEAIRSTRSAGICAANADGSNCGTDWSLGWLVWTNTDADPDFDPAKDTVVRYVQVHSQLAMAAANGDEAGIQPRIFFDNRGRVQNAPAAGSIGIKLQPDHCPTGENVVRVLTVMGTGQADSVKGACP